MLVPHSELGCSGYSQNSKSIEVAILYETGEYEVEDGNFVVIGQIISKNILLFFRIRQSEQMHKKLKSICKNIKNIEHVEPVLDVNTR